MVNTSNMEMANSLDSETTVKRRRAELRLTGSHATTQSMPHQEAEQLVLNQMDKDSSRRQGVRTVQARIAFDTHTHLTRDFVCTFMMRKVLLTVTLVPKRYYGSRRILLVFTSDGLATAMINYIGSGFLSGLLSTMLQAGG